MVQKSIVLNLLLLLTLKWSGVSSCTSRKFEAFLPAGFRISEPYVPGASDVSFYITVSGNKIIADGYPIPNPTNRCWVFEDRNTKLKKNNEISFSYEYIFRNEKIYGGGTFIVTEFEGKSAPVEVRLEKPQANCSLSFTRLYDGKNDKDHRHPCNGELIFYDDFKDFDRFKRNDWTTVERFPYTSDFEFAVYQNSVKNIIIRNGLKITPRLMSEEYGEDFIGSGSLTLKKCTSKDQHECKRKARGWSIMHPVSSGRLNTRKSLNFMYGRVEIKARLPRGDWLYPLLMLESEEGETSNYQIRIASSAGNELFGRELWGGMINATSSEDRFNNSNKVIKLNPELWSKDFHTYAMTWIPGVITSTILFEVDGKTYGQKDIKPLPKNTPFYLTIGLGVGGVMEFPESTAHVYQKPWKNTDPKAMCYFNEDRKNWLKTWQPHPSLEVDYVKVWAL